MSKEIKIKSLIWETLNGHFGSDYMARIEGFSVNYYYWFDRNAQKFKCSGIDRQHHYFGSEQEVREWCQKDLEEKIKQLIDL